mgnify:CR=1 FL=1
MSFTIIKGMELPEVKRQGFFKRGSKFDTVLADLNIGDCVKFDCQKEANYFAKVLRDKEKKGSVRKIENSFYVWRII